MRAASVLAVLLAALAPSPLLAAADSGQRALREMQIHRVVELGLEIWVENQPAWETQMSAKSGHPGFYAQSPWDYVPPAVMSFASWPKEKVEQKSMQAMATKAIKQASLNFGLTPAQSGSILALKAEYGVLSGYEATFPGTADGVPIDVTVFVGQQQGKFPVALSIYTIRGKINALAEQRRRAWTNIRYLEPARR